MAVTRAGEVVRIAQGLVILRTDERSRIDIGVSLVDDSLNRVGRVVDVFGPVERPYVAMTAAHEHPSELLGERLYARR